MALVYGGNCSNTMARGVPIIDVGMYVLCVLVVAYKSSGGNKIKERVIGWCENYCRG